MSAALDGTAVLVVDDDAESVEILSYVIADAGAIVRTATSARAALAILLEWTPDVLLLDISMPDMDGFDLLKAIRGQPQHSKTPAVAITGYASLTDRAFEAGFSVHIEKPFEADALVELVDWLAQKPVRKGSRSRPPS